MYILGDIGNSETKIFLLDENSRILKRSSFLTKKLNNRSLNIKLKKFTKNINEVKKYFFVVLFQNHIV